MFDLIGDVHGCADELDELLYKLGGKNKVVFLGDLCDRGPKNLEVLEIVMRMVKSGEAHAILGNHDDKLRRWLKSKVKGEEPRVKLAHGLKKTVDELETQSMEKLREIYQFLSGLPWRLSLVPKKLIAVHAACPEKHQWGYTKKDRSVALYGLTTGRTLANGYPERLDWAKDYEGEATVVHGHVVHPTVRVGGANGSSKVWCIDTGCVFGGHLTALRYPSMEIVQVRAHETYDDSKSNLCFS